MKTIFTTLIFLIFYFHCFSQCDYVWLDIRKNPIDTIKTKTNWIYNDSSISSEIDLSTLTKILRPYRIDGELREKLLSELDSLKKSKVDTTISKKIDFLEYELHSRFQIVKLKSIEFALYSIDTLIFDDKTVVIYQFSSNFKTEWNEDYNNWRFYYTNEFGIIYAYYECIFYYDDNQCFRIITLFDNCKTRANRILFSETMKNFNPNKIRIR